MKHVVFLACALTLTVGGCSKKDEALPPEPSPAESPPPAQEPPASATQEPTAAEVPVAEDFEEQAAAEIRADNYKAELERLDKELEADESL